MPERDLSVAADKAELASQHLAGLRAELARRGVASRVITSGCWPRLLVDNERTGARIADAVFEATVVAVPCPAGQWCFWRPWIEQVGPAGDVRAAASVITRALACADTRDRGRRRRGGRLRR